MPLILKYDVAFNPINLAFFSFVRIMLETNNIANLFEPFFRRFFDEMIARKILDIMIIWYDFQKVSRYHQRIYRKFRDITLLKIDIRTKSIIYPIQGGYPESFSIVNS